MELHRARLATSAKLRAEWDRRLDKNALAIDILSSNQQLWESAGGPDPESLGNPTESGLDHCAKTVVVLQAMLAKHGPSGGLDSFVQDRHPMLQRVSTTARSGISWVYHANHSHAPASLSGVREGREHAKGCLVGGHSEGLLQKRYVWEHPVIDVGGRDGCVKRFVQPRIAFP